MSALSIAEELLVGFAVRVIEKVIDNPSANVRERIRREAKIQAQRLLVEHAADLTLAAKQIFSPPKKRPPPPSSRR